MPTNSAAWLGAKQARLEVKPAPYTHPRENEIIVKNHAVAINPLDWIIQLETKSSKKVLDHKQHVRWSLGQASRKVPVPVFAIWHIDADCVSTFEQ